MYVKNLSIFQFRNIEPASIPLSPELNFIVGRNGQGKTNLVEAITILSSGKSFRASSVKQVIGWGFEEASVACSLSESVSDIDLRVVLRARGREYLVNDNKVNSLSDFVGKLVTVSFAPDDLQIVSGGPAERRKCIDRHIVDKRPAALRHFIDYQKALKSKNVLLKSGGATASSVEPWNQLIVREARKIGVLRQEFLNDLELEANDVHRHFGASDGAIRFELDSFALTEDGGVRNESEMLAALEADFQRERILKVSKLGVHRDDVKIFLNDRDSRAYASQGQVRSIVLSIKLGVIALLEKVRGDSPVILLDDVDSELDKKRSDSFFDLLLDQGRQVVITGTHFDEKRLKRSSLNKVFEVSGGSFLDTSTPSLLAV